MISTKTMLPLLMFNYIWILFNYLTTKQCHIINLYLILIRNDKMKQVRIEFLQYLKLKDSDEIIMIASKNVSNEHVCALLGHLYI